MIRHLRRFLRRLFTLPPHIVARKGTRKLFAFARSYIQLMQAQLLPTYGENWYGSAIFYHLKTDLSTLPDPPEWLAPVTQLYLQHRFDLLGSGWVNVSLGAISLGIQGIRYDPDTCAPSSLINRGNRTQSQRINQLLPNDYQRIDWHRDFKSGYRWRGDVWYQKISYGHLPGVDVKVPWELGRMQHLPQLALAALYASRGAQGFKLPERYRDEIRHQILDFMTHNPPRWGVNWACTMDVGIRVANWLLARDLLKAGGITFDQDFEVLLTCSVYDHAYHITTNLEWSEELHGNHYLADIAGLLFASAYLPSCPKVDAWLAFSTQELFNEILSQFHPDGSNFEASTCYHRLSTEIVVFSAALIAGLDQNRYKALIPHDHPITKGPRSLQSAGTISLDQGVKAVFSKISRQRIQKMGYFVQSITRPDGNIPQFGDNDSGRFFKISPNFISKDAKSMILKYKNLSDYGNKHQESNYWYDDNLNCFYLSSTISALFSESVSSLDAWVVRSWMGQQNVLQKVEEFGVQQKLTVGDVKVWSQWWKQTNCEGEQCHCTCFSLDNKFSPDSASFFAYPNFGLYVIRSHQIFLAIRCGSIGQNGNGGHAHNDQLALELVIDGVDYIRDPGTWIYTPFPEQRNAYRSVQAHFIPRIGQDEFGDLEAGLFTLPSHSLMPQVIYFGPKGFIGGHRGYGAYVWRCVSFEADHLIVVDRSDDKMLLEPEIPSIAYSPGYGWVEYSPQGQRDG